jgi:hypothetical protein
MKAKVWQLGLALLAGLPLAMAQDGLQPRAAERRAKPLDQAAGMAINVDDKSLPEVRGTRPQGLDRATGRALDGATGRALDGASGRALDGVGGRMVEDRGRGLPPERMGAIEAGRARGLNESVQGGKPLDAPSGLRPDKQSEKALITTDSMGALEPALGVYGLRDAPRGNRLNTQVDAGRQAAWEAAQAQAGQRIKDFDAALKSGQPESIRKAALELGSDPLAVQKINQGHPELVNAHNQVTGDIKAQTRQNIKENMAKQWNTANPDKPPISAKDVEVYEPTNWREPGAAPKSGQDWDVTVRVKGKDVPPSQSKKVVEKAYFDAAGGEQTFGKGATPEHVAHKQAIETTHGKSPEAYNEPKKILGTDTQRPQPGKNLQDPEQLTHAVENKSMQSRNKAADARTGGDQVEAVRQDYEQMRQASKQYENITKPRVEAHGGKIHDKVDEGMRILGEVGPNGRSPESARAKLAELGETPESIIRKASGQAEAAEKLGGGRKPPSETPEGRPHAPTDTPEGRARGPVADVPEGKPRVATDAPDGAPVKPGKLGKALDKLGKGMQAVDIFSNAEDAKQAIKDGDMKKLGEVGINTVDGFTGGAIGTGRLVNDRLNTARGEKNEEQAEARRMAAAAHEQQLRVDLRKGGYSREQVDQIMNARSKGDDSQLKAGYEKLGKEMPRPMVTDPTWKESLKNYGHEVADNTVEVATGIKDKTVKAGKFLNDTRKDVSEIGSGLTESGTRKELINQQSANISDWWTHGSGWKENQAAGQTVAGGKDGMKEYLIGHGATPEGAQKAADALYDKGDGSQFQRLMTMLKDKEARRLGQQPENKEAAGKAKQDALKQSEAGAADPTAEALKKGDASNVLEWLGSTKADKAAKHTTTSLGLNQNQQQVADASKSGDAETHAAGLAKDAAGAEAHNTRSQGAAQTAADQQKNSWNNVMGDALAQGLAAGGAALGGAVGAGAAAHAGASLFGAGARPGAGTSSGHKKEGQGTAATAPTAKDSGAKGGGTKDSGVPPVATGGPQVPASNKGTTGPSGGAPATTAPIPSAPAPTAKTPSQNCPKCGKAMIPIVVPKDPSKVDDYRWTCLACGFKDNRPLPTVTVATTSSVPVKATPPAVTAAPPAKPPPVVRNCPNCKGVVTEKDEYMSNYGRAIHCPHCKGSVKIYW